MLFTLHILYINSLWVANNIYNIFFLKKKERERSPISHRRNSLWKDTGAASWNNNVDQRRNSRWGEAGRGETGTVHGHLRNIDTSPIYISLGWEDGLCKLDLASLNKCWLVMPWRQAQLTERPFRLFWLSLLGASNPEFTNLWNFPIPHEDLLGVQFGAVYK